MASWYDAVLVHPFLTGVSDGTLDPECFTYYLAQDSHYLNDYARALATLGGRAPSARDGAVLVRHAAGAVEVEATLHGSLLAQVGVDPAALAEVPVSPTTYAYSRHLLAAVALGSFAEGLAAVLPCYWIYARVGAALVEGGSSEPRFQRWIDTYAGEEFVTVVDEVIELVDRTGPSLTPEQRSRAERGAVVSARYEWMFWDAALRREQWSR